MVNDMQLTQELLLDDQWQELVVTQIDAQPDYPRALVLQAAVNNGAEDAACGRYYPPRPSDKEAFDAYLKSYNDTWAKLNGRVLLR